MKRRRDDLGSAASKQYSHRGFSRRFPGAEIVLLDQPDTNGQEKIDEDHKDDHPIQRRRYNLHD